MRCPVCGTVHQGSGPCCCVQCELKLKHHFRSVTIDARGNAVRGPRIEVPSSLVEELSQWVPPAER
jgi:hypothetical protein